jgi:hypothetical protein
MSTEPQEKEHAVEALIATIKGRLWTAYAYRLNEGYTTQELAAVIYMTPEAFVKALDVKPNGHMGTVGLLGHALGFEFDLSLKPSSPIVDEEKSTDTPMQSIDSIMESLHMHELNEEVVPEDETYEYHKQRQESFKMAIENLKNIVNKQ